MPLTALATLDHQIAIELFVSILKEIYIKHEDLRENI
jgi:hypothetical protein